MFFDHFAKWVILMKNWDLNNFYQSLYDNNKILDRTKRYNALYEPVGCGYQLSMDKCVF
jgi:hypothetical protein